MPDCIIQSVSTVDARFSLPPGAGTDSVHTNAKYCMAITRLTTDEQMAGSGIALTLGDETRSFVKRLICSPNR